MHLFTLESDKIKVSPEALLIIPFKAIWDRDKSKNKERAYAELAYLYFTADYKSDYLAYSEKDREEKLRDDVIKDPKWKADETIKIAIKKYEELQETPALRMLKGARNAAEAVTDFYNSLGKDGSEADGKNVQAIMASLEKLGKVVESIDKLENKIRLEQHTDGRSKGGRRIGKFED